MMALGLGAGYIALILINLLCYRFPPDCLSVVFMLLGAAAGVVAAWIWERIIADSEKKTNLHWSHIIGSAALGFALSYLTLELLLFLGDSNESTLGAGIKAKPPWILLSGIATAPTLLLLWYWRHQIRSREVHNDKRERDQGDREHFATTMDAGVAATFKLQDIKAAYLGIHQLEYVALEQKNRAAVVIERLERIIEEANSASESELSIGIAVRAKLAIVRIVKKYADLRSCVSPGVTLNAWRYPLVIALYNGLGSKVRLVQTRYRHLKGRIKTGDADIGSITNVEDSIVDVINTTDELSKTLAQIFKREFKIHKENEPPPPAS
jgi:hypothetical protein